MAELNLDVGEALDLRLGDLQARAVITDLTYEQRPNEFARVTVTLTVRQVDRSIYSSANVRDAVEEVQKRIQSSRVLLGE